MLVSVGGLRQIMQKMGKDLSLAYHAAVDYFGDRLIKRKFTHSGNRESNFKPLSNTYAQRKMRKYGVQPILVASGDLKRAVTKGYRVVSRAPGKFYLALHYPRYGAFQRQDGRDFLKLSPRDKKDILRFLRTDFLKRRSKSK